MNTTTTPNIFDPEMMLKAVKDDSISVPGFITVNNNGSFTIPVSEKEHFKLAYLKWCQMFYIQTSKRKTYIVLADEAKNIILALYRNDIELLEKAESVKHENIFSEQMVAQLCFVLLTMRIDLTTDLVKFGDFVLIGSGDKVEYIIEMKLRGCNFITFKFTAGRIDVSTDSVSSKQPTSPTLHMSIITILDMWKMVGEDLTILSTTKLVDGVLDQVAHQYLLRALPVRVKLIVETEFIS